MITRSLKLIAFILILSSCGKQDKGELNYFRPTKKMFNKVINTNSIQSGDLHKDIHLFTKYIKYTGDTYTMEISLYDDGNYYYDFEKVGDGKGKWKYEDGVLKLENKKEILGMEIDMNYQIKSMDENGGKLMIFFRDRKGLNSYPLTIRNSKPTD